MTRRYWTLSAAAASLLGAQQTAAPQTEKLAPYYPTPESVVEKMLQFGALKSGEKHFDLGSGDGRIVIMAADKYKADSTGVEFDLDLFKQSSDRIRKRGLEKTGAHYSRRRHAAELRFSRSPYRVPVA